MSHNSFKVKGVERERKRLKKRYGMRVDGAGRSLALALKAKAENAVRRLH